MPNPEFGSTFFSSKLGAEPGVQVVHDRPAVLLVKTEPLVWRHPLLLGLRLVPIHRGETFQHVPTLFRKAGHRVHKVATGMSGPSMSSRGLFARELALAGE